MKTKRGCVAKCEYGNPGKNKTGIYPAHIRVCPWYVWDDWMYLKPNRNLNSLHYTGVNTFNDIHINKARLFGYVLNAFDGVVPV